MKFRPIFHIQGLLLVFIGTFMLFPALFSWYYGEDDLKHILISAGITIGVGLVLWRTLRFKGELKIRESFAIVSMGWLSAALFGALPFYLSGYIPSFTDAFFETMSGFTTTGASILTDIESLPHGLLFWRSLTHWLGGMGIIVLSLAILPLLGIGGMQLFKAEIPGPVADKLTPRIQQTAKLLWMVYVIVSGAETVLLLLGGMDLFDALCHTFGTMATGGFSTKNASIAHFGSYVQYVIIFFMILAGTNFSLHYNGLRGRVLTYWRNEEFRFFMSILLICTALLTLDNLLSVYPDLTDAIRNSLFQAVSILTTTGYVTADYEKWSAAGQFLMLFLMFIGGSAGSTGGSIKVLRIMIVLKHGYAELRRLIHPHAVIPVRVNGHAISANVVNNIFGFIFLYFSILVTVTFIMTLLGLDLVSGFASAAATLGNIGPALGTIGPTDNYAHIPLIGKWILTFCMLAGRLELYTVLLLLTREFWKG
jgi:trk system potassium uptake protein TrkH